MTPIENLERQRSEFLGMVSHELRLPLTSIKGSADTLLELGPDLDPAEVRQFSRIIRDQSERMRHMIVDLLDAARIETGTLSVNPEPSPVLAMADEAKQRFLTGGGQNDLQISLLPDLPPVMADQRRIVQVLNNFLSNAAVFFTSRVEYQGVGRTRRVSCGDFSDRRRAWSVRGAGDPHVPHILSRRRR